MLKQRGGACVQIVTLFWRVALGIVFNGVTKTHLPPIIILRQTCVDSDFS